MTIPHLASNLPHSRDIRYSISREAILGHESGWQVSDFGAAQFRHGYDPELLATIAEKAHALKAQYANKKHLDLTFITGADRYIPEINDLIQDQNRLDTLSDFAGTKLEPYPLSIVGSTVTFMGPSDGAVDWHSDGVPVTELIPLEISDPIIGGELEIYLDNCEAGKAQVIHGTALAESKVMRMPHRLGYSTLGHFLGILHRTRPILFGHRLTLVLNLRSQTKPFVDDNRICYLAADTDQEQGWVDDVVKDVWEHQLPAYRRFERLRTEVGEFADPEMT